MVLVNLLKQRARCSWFFLSPDNSSALTALLLIEPLVTLVMAGTLGVGAVVYYRLAAPRFRRWGQLAIAIEAEMIKWINQSFANFAFLKIEHKGCSCGKIGNAMPRQTD